MCRVSFLIHSDGNDVVVDALDVGAQAVFGIDDVPRILLVGVWLKLVGLEGVNLFLCKHMYIIPYLRTTGVASMHRAMRNCIGLFQQGHICSHSQPQCFKLS